MAITIPHSFTSGAIAEASEMNANFNAVKEYKCIYDKITKK